MQNESHADMTCCIKPRRKKERKYFIQKSDEVSRPLFRRLPVTVSRMRALNRLVPGPGVPAVDLA